MRPRGRNFATYLIPRLHLLLILLLTMAFEDCFSFYEIVKALCAIRIKLASARHSYQLYWSRLQIVDSNGCDLSPDKKVCALVSQLLPPRRLWHRDRQEVRRHQSAASVAEQSILRIVMGMYKAGVLGKNLWGEKLLQFCNEVRFRVIHGDIKLNPPSLQLIRKNQGRVRTLEAKQQETAYRCISKFDSLHDRIILGRTAYYLRNLVDHELLDCCYAFRKNGRRFSLQTAVADLIEYRKHFLEETLYVADCDVQKFFDVINHDVILSAYDSFVQRLKDNAPDSRVRCILREYLDVYSFPNNLDECQDNDISTKKAYVSRVPKETLSALYPGVPLEEVALGIPQGGALSPLLANLVMDSVDRAVLANADDELFYARFCDDIIIIHPNKKKCLDALHRYLNAMELLKLPVHKLAKPYYGASYFTEKSKGPIAWKKTKSGLPATNWVSFLGHQVRYDGVVRIRKETLQKHKEKLGLELVQLAHNLKMAKGVYRSGFEWRELFHMFKLRMVAIGTGKVNQEQGCGYSRYWFSVFRQQILPKGPVLGQLKELDRMRTRLSKAAKVLLKHTRQNREMPEHKVSDKDQPHVRRFYLGAPFSYYGAAKELSRPSLQNTILGNRKSATDYKNI